MIRIIIIIIIFSGEEGAPVGFFFRGIYDTLTGSTETLYYSQFLISKAGGQEMNRTRLKELSTNRTAVPVCRFRAGLKPQIGIFPRSGGDED